MLKGPLTGLLVQPIDVGLQLLLVDAPHAPAADLNRGKVPTAHQRIDLLDADTEVFRHVLVVLMTSALVVAIWTVAQDRLVDIVRASLDSVCGSVGC